VSETVGAKSGGGSTSGAVSGGGSTVGAKTGGGSTAWFHCFAGIAGDMALGSLLDAGADLDEVQSILKRLPFAGWSLRTEPVLRGGIAATRAVVSVTDNVVVRTHAHIVGLVEEARLPGRVAQRSLAVFAALAAAEARLHRKPMDQVHFHEVGGHDTIVDVVGTVAALEVLGVDAVTASPVATGTGMVRAAHGMLPNPAPAVVALLEGAPTWGRDLAVELTTPTGAALLAALSSGYGPMPPMRIIASGFGAGTRDLAELPNCTQVVLGQPVTLPGTTPDAGAGQPVTLLEANVDDATGEQLAYAVSTLLEMGAHDAWLSPIVMKKGRPGSTIHVLCDPADAARIRASVRAETGTLGVRGTTIQRWPVSRAMGTVDVDGHAIRIKASPGRIKAEFDDVARAARDTGIPLREMAARAEGAWRAQANGDSTANGDSENNGGSRGNAAGPTRRDQDEGPTA
jgi:pyridinium-3,5-bisthiocarboxylic acid mononucleotide nickel chelatase